MARAQPLCQTGKLRISICLPPNKAQFNEVVLFIHGKEVSEYEHKRPAAANLLDPPSPSSRVPVQPGEGFCVQFENLHFLIRVVHLNSPPVC